MGIDIVYDFYYVRGWGVVDRMGEERERERERE